ncbi:arylsulfatase A-like enzyme [Knoellia remsis]|uniref:Arylsulfatase A-like enzyme n=2 Tax=Knoellia remsis TaxID=407159 RepID=A0A2T0UQY0_9MICO|nr:arylsulfatase A-like enzyme [Knoellia remsis]
METRTQQPHPAAHPTTSSTPTSSIGRRGVLAGAAAALAGLGALPQARAATGSPAATSGTRPNILFVLADDLGWGELGSYGQRTIRTPVLDQLAADGMRFTDSYANPTCAPTRFSLLTGYHTGHARITQNTQAITGLVPSDVTVGEVLQDAGYRTACIGKWGFGPDSGDSPSHPNLHGFDHFMGYLTNQHAHDYWPTYLWRNSERVEYPENASADVTYSGTIFTDECVSFLEDDSSDQPFFLFASYTTPHAPNAHPTDAPYSGQPWPEGERMHAAQVTWLDAQVGRLLDTLRRQGTLDNTLVIFTSDNGPHKEGDYPWVGSTTTHDVEFFDSNGPFRGQKRDVYEGGIRVPMIALVPPSMRTDSTPAAGSVIDTPTGIWDLLPTCADVAGAPTPAGLDGRSWYGTLTRGTDIDRPYIYVSSPEGGFRESVRFGQWKAVRTPWSNGTQLFKLANDPGETRNIAAQHPAVVRRAATLMADAKA